MLIISYHLLYGVGKGQGRFDLLEHGDNIEALIWSRHLHCSHYELALDAVLTYYLEMFRIDEIIEDEVISQVGRVFIAVINEHPH